MQHQTYFSNHPQQFRFLFISVAVFLSVLAATTLYVYSSAPFDENWFNDAPSRVYIKKTVVFRDIAKPKSTDTMRTNDLVIGIGEARVRTMSELKNELQKSSAAKTVMIKIFRPSIQSSFDMEILRSTWTDDLVFEIPHCVLNVIDVVEGGASDRAGMKTGDLIVRINDRDFKNSLDADRHLRSSQIGKTLVYEVFRDNQYVKLNVRLAKFGFPWSVLATLISGLVFFGMALFIGLKRPKLVAARLIAWGFLLAGFLMFVIAIRRDLDPTLFVRLRNLTLLFCAYGGAAILFHSTFYFPKERPEILSRKWVTRVLYVIIIIGFGVSIFFPGDRFNLGIITIVFYSLFIFWKFRKQSSPEYRRLIRPIKYSCLIALLLGILILAFFGGTNVSLQRQPPTNLVYLLLPAAYLYTIGRYRLLDLDIRIRRSIRYSFATVLWIIALVYLFIATLFTMEVDVPNVKVAFTGTSIVVNDTSPGAPLEMSLERAIVILATLLIGFGFVKLRRIGQRFIDRRYFRTSYDYRRAGNELSEIMAKGQGMVPLAKAIAERLADLVKLKRVGVLFLRDEQECCCLQVYGFDGEQWNETCIGKTGQIVDAVKYFHGEIRVEYLPASLRSVFHDQGFSYLVPIWSKEKLIGVLLVGEKQSEAPLDGEDITFLSVVAKQASVAIENAFLYEELAEQERMRQELEIARRIQLASLPQQTPKVQRLDISGTSIPASEVGGDFYDYLVESENRLTVIIGDVSGKGTSAALYMSKVQGIFRSLHTFHLAPSELFVRANQLLCQDLDKRSFVTAIAAFFDTTLNTMTFVRAGHLPIYHFRKTTDQVEKILPKGIGIGLNAKGTFVSELHEEQVPYVPGDILVFVTDGIIEARNAEGTEFGEGQLLQAIAKASDRTAEQVRDHILAAVKEFCGSAPQHDDQTMVVVRSIPG